jgi:hypothetical protein
VPAKKPAKPQPKAAPQFDADPIEDDEQPPFTLDDDGNMVLRRDAAKRKPKAPARRKKHGG